MKPPPMESVLAGVGNSQSGKVDKSQKGPQGTTNDIIGTLARLALAHDRQLQELADRSTFIVAVKKLEDKKYVASFLEKWQKAKPSETGKPHPFGCSQRATVFTSLIKLFSDNLSKVEAAGTENEEKSAANRAAGEAFKHLQTLTIPDIVQSVFRLKPKYPKYLEEDNRAWIWLLVIGVAAPAHFREAMVTLGNFHCTFEKNLVMAPSRSQDGPLAKDLAKWIKAHPTRKPEGDASTEAEEQGGGKRKKQG